MDIARIIGLSILLAVCSATALAARPREAQGLHPSVGFAALPQQDADTRREIRTLPAERGGQELVGRKWPTLTFDRMIEGTTALRAVSPDSTDDNSPGSTPGSESRATESRATVTLYRWWTSGCLYCERSLPAIEQWRERFEERGLRIIAVYHPKPPRPSEQISDEFIIRTAKSLGYTGTLALDSGWSQLRIATRGWRDRRATSVSFLIDHEGVIRFVHPGLDYFASDDPEHTRQRRDHELLEAAIEALLHELAEAKAEQDADAE